VLTVSHWLHKPHVTISQRHALTSQSSVVVTQLHTIIAPHVIFPEGWKPELSAPGVEPGLPAHISEHALERLMPKPTELATETDRQTYYILPGGREHQLLLVSPSPSETPRPAGLNYSACGLTEAVVASIAQPAASLPLQFMGVA